MAVCSGGGGSGWGALRVSACFHSVCAHSDAQQQQQQRRKRGAERIIKFEAEAVQDTADTPATLYGIRFVVIFSNRLLIIIALKKNQHKKS